jgi:peptidoglycan hydrolase-like protein with peptidoglycan-binding domain
MQLQLGSQGAEVLNLERVINALGYSGFEIDGEFDEKTRNVIINIQKTNGLDADGICGPKTFDLLDRLYEPTKPNFSSSNFLTTQQVKTVLAEVSNPSALPKVLEGVHPLLARKALQMVEIAKSEGYTIQISQGLRTFDQQNWLYAQGRSRKGKVVTNAPGGKSYHNYGIAVDFVFFVLNKATGKMEVSWDEKLYRNLGRWAKQVGLEWGGNWRFVDLPHCQLPNMTSIKSLLATYNANGGGDKGIQAVWRKFVVE